MYKIVSRYVANSWQHGYNGSIPVKKELWALKRKPNQRENTRTTLLLYVPRNYELGWQRWQRKKKEARAT